MEIIVLSLVLVVLILLFIRINMLNQNIDVLMCRVDNVNDSIDTIEEDLKAIKENINKLENLCAGISNSCASISSYVNSGFSKIINDKSISVSLEMTRNIIKDGFNTQSKDLHNAANMLNNDITNISDSMAAAHKELMCEIKANKTPKPRTTKNTNKEKKAVNQPENCR